MQYFNHEPVASSRSFVVFVGPMLLLNISENRQTCYLPIWTWCPPPCQKKHLEKKLCQGSYGKSQSWGRRWLQQKILLFRRAPPSPRLVRQGDSAFFIICIVCSFFPGSFGVVFSQLCNVFCVGPPSPPGALSSLSPLWGCMPLGTYKQLTSQLGSLLQPGPDSFHPWFHT